LFVPRFVTNCTCTAPSAPASAVSPDEETVTSSSDPSRTGANVKKLVPPLRNRCELLLMPSSVMLMHDGARRIFRGADDLPRSTHLRVGRKRGGQTRDRQRRANGRSRVGHGAQL
jgi:hypothetical protein